MFVVRRPHDKQLIRRGFKAMLVWKSEPDKIEAGKAAFYSIGEAQLVKNLLNGEFAERLEVIRSQACIDEVL
jgi:hypothetical protein